MFHYFSDYGVKKNIFIVRTLDNRAYVYESTIIEPIHVFRSIRSKEIKDIEVEDLEGDKVAISIAHIVSIEEYRGDGINDR